MKTSGVHPGKNSSAGGGGTPRSHVGAATAASDATRKSMVVSLAVGSPKGQVAEAIGMSRSCLTRWRRDLNENVTVTRVEGGFRWSDGGSGVENRSARGEAVLGARTGLPRMRGNGLSLSCERLASLPGRLPETHNASVGVGFMWRKAAKNWHLSRNGSSFALATPIKVAVRQWRHRLESKIDSFGHGICCASCRMRQRAF